MLLIVGYNFCTIGFRGPFKAVLRMSQRPIVIHKNYIFLWPKCGISDKPLVSWDTQGMMTTTVRA